MKPHRGTLVLVIGILGLVICAPLGIAAQIMGKGDLAEMDAGAMDPSGRGMTSAGKICGLIATILLGLSILAVIGVMALGIGGAAFGAALKALGSQFGGVICLEPRTQGGQVAPA